MTNNILLYHLDNETAYGENSTTVNDFSSQNNDGIVGEAGWTTSGKLDGAYDFDNTEEIYRDPISIDTNMSISLWAYADTFSQSGTFISKMPVNTQWLLFVNSGLVKFRGGSSGSDVTCAVPTGGEWHHFAATIEGTVGKVFIDGTECNSGTMNAINNGMVSGTNDIVIGAYDKVGGYSFDGKIDEVALWNDVLTPTEVGLIHSTQSPSYERTYTSRIMDAGGSVAWSTLAWTPDRPFYKALPDSGVSETEYSNGNANMTSNELLMHFDEASWSGVTGEVTDSSGNNRDGTRVNTANTTSSAKFSRAGIFNGTNDRVLLDSDWQASLPITISAWIRPDTILDAMGIVDTDSGTNYRGVFLVLASSQYLQINYGDGSGTGPTDRRTKLGSTQLQPDEWYHVVAVVRGATDMDLYLNGVDDGGTYSGTTNTLSNSASAPTIGVARMSGGNYFFHGEIDEVAIWSRSLSSDEVMGLYRRGANHLKFQVRSCDDDACSGESFTGPSGVSNYYTESTDGDLGLPSINLSIDDVPNNRYFQYKAFMEINDYNYSPELKSVDVGPTHYDASNPTIQPTAPVEALYGIEGFSETLGGSNAGTVKYQISPDGATWYYHNGSTWTTASGYAQTNTAAEVNTNAEAAETVLTSGSFYFKAFLNSALGAQAVELDTVAITTKEGGKKRDVTAPEGVTNPQIELTNDHHVHISWTNPNDSDLDRIVILRGEDPDPVSGSPIIILNKDVIEFVDTTVEEGKSYTYIVATEDGSKARNRRMSRKLKITVQDEPAIEEITEEIIEEIVPVEVELPVAYTEEEMLSFVDEKIRDLTTNYLQKLQLTNDLVGYFGEIGMGKFMKEPENDEEKIETINRLLSEIDPKRIDEVDISTIDGTGGPESVVTNLGDVKINDWFYDAVNILGSRCTINIKQKNGFRPNDTVIQAEFIKMLFTTDCSQKDFEGDLLFNNIDDSKWYYGGYSQLMSKVSPNIDLIEPARPLSRGEAAYWIFAHSEGGTASYITNSPAFKDVTNKYQYYDAINWANDNNIITGYYDSTFKPYQILTRAEAAVIIHRLRQK